MSGERWPTPELAELATLGHEVDDWLSPGFEMYPGIVRDGLASGWSSDSEFLARLMPFAQANHSGSFYALWLPDREGEPDAIPVVVFGDEGGEHVVAASWVGFLQLLACNAVVVVDGADVTFVVDDDETSSDETRAALVSWLHARCAVGPPPGGPEVVLAEARSSYGRQFREWMSRYR